MGECCGRAGNPRLYLTFPIFSAILVTTEEYIISYGGRDEKGTGQDIRSEGYWGSAVHEMDQQKIFSCGGKFTEETVYYSDSAAEYHGPAPHGACPWQYAAGHPDPV